jgi:4-amino-4-deoxy-L-arabinose transferase-like glycosyltransferase
VTTLLTRPTTGDPASPATGPGRRSAPEWTALAVLLAGTGALYLWNLAASGWANSFYAAAVQAGTQDWTAFLFGSLDAGNAITVDKPPASLWPMEIAGRIVGFSSWSMLVPQALMGVAAVALLYAAVRRVAGPGAGLVAGALLALTPVAALMFRFNNPDALLTLLMVAAAYCTTRAAERGRTRWILLAGLVIGFAFLAKSLQAFLVAPGMAAAFLWAAPGTVRRRITQLLGAGVAIVVGAGWWLLAVALWPVSARPYIGGSGDNTPLGLAFGYNGLGRIVGGEDGGPGGFADVPGGADAAGGLPGAVPGGLAGGGMPPGGGGPGGGGFGGQAGVLRLVNESFATQASWLLPAAVLLLVAALWLTRRAARTDRVRAGLVLWGGWTLVTAAVFSFMNGIIHPYYTVALAPGIAATVAIGGAVLLRHRQGRTARIALAVATAGTAAWAFVLLGRSAEFLPWLRWAVLVLGFLAGAAFLLSHGRRRWVGVVAGTAVLAGVAAPAAYAVQTAATAHTGSMPSAGPTVAGERGGPGAPADRVRDGGDRAGAAAPGAAGAGGPAAGTTGGSGTPGGGTAGPGGPGEERTSAELTSLLRDAQSSGVRWAAATVGSQGAASMELASGASVMAIGGFTGSDAYPTLEQFQAYVHDGQVRYLVTGQGRGGPGGDRGTGAQITAWVATHYTATTVGGQTVYDLSAVAR